MFILFFRFLIPSFLFFCLFIHLFFISFSFIPFFKTIRFDVIFCLIIIRCSFSHLCSFKLYKASVCNVAVEKPVSAFKYCMYFMYFVCAHINFVHRMGPGLSLTQQIQLSLEHCIVQKVFRCY